MSQKQFVAALNESDNATNNNDLIMHQKLAILLLKTLRIQVMIIYLLSYIITIALWLLAITEQETLALCLTGLDFYLCLCLSYNLCYSIE